MAESKYIKDKGVAEEYKRLGPARIEENPFLYHLWKFTSMPRQK